MKNLLDKKSRLRRHLHTPMVVTLIMLIGFGFAQGVYANEEEEVPSITITQENCELASSYSEGSDGLSLLVMINDQVIYEEYHNGHGADTIHRLASGTKSFWGVAAICAEEDRLLSLDELAADTLNEWKDNPRKSTITIRHLLTFTSGLDPATAVLRGPSQNNKYDYVLGLEMRHDAGEGFYYGPSHLFAFGELLRRKLDAAGKEETVLAYLKRRVLDPIGLDIGLWRSDKAGNPQLPFGAFLSAREWAKYGKLILHGGSWNGKTIIPTEKLKQCFVGTEANPIYGLNWWLIGLDDGDDPEAPRIPADTVAAMGKDKQRLYIVPSLNLVVVRQGTSQAFQDADFLNRLLFGLQTSTPRRRERQGQQ
ncbi:MAG: serine hydrolase [Candidatus Hydrogenedentota bacterium]